VLIAQLSDLHVFDRETAQVSDFFNKRAIGGLNLVTGRRNAHPIELTERLIEDVTRIDPDHVVVTGDVTNLSLPGEFQRVSRLLRPLWGYERLTVIPGNHDCYTQGAQDEQRFERFFGELLFGQDSAPETWRYPAIKDLGDVVIVAMSSALKTGPFMAWGRVGQGQLDRLERELRDRDLLDKFTIGLVHHNLHKRDKIHEMTASLRDRDEVLARLLGLRMNILCHGHTHRAHRFDVSLENHTMLVIGSGSSTQNSMDPERVARYNLTQVENGEARIRTRVYDPTHRRFEWLV
jgi:3',5'-cyclic AMP phosphodiesterase CpdA